MVTRARDNDAGRATPVMPRRAPSALAVGVLVFTLAIVVALVGGGWHYSTQLLSYPAPEAAWDPDQQAAVVDGFGVDAEPWTVDGPLGTYGGVHVPGDADTWVIMVHGRGGPVGQGAQLVPVMAGADLPVLLTSFRNDGLAPDAPDGHGTFGDREWRDLQAWVDAAEDAGARSIVLYGFSLGGSVIASFLQESPDADIVSAVVLDSPVLSLHELLELQAEGVGIPDPLVEPLVVATKAAAVVRTGMDFAALEHVARWDADVPVLLVHGDADTTVPDGPTVALARRLDDVALERPAGVGHVAWSEEDPAAYAAALERFLDAEVDVP